MTLASVRRWLTVLAASCLAMGTACASGLDPSQAIGQYGHTAWKNGEDFVPGIIRSIAQTPDGYIWLGTSFGPYRFDGVRAVAWHPPEGKALPDDRVLAMLSSRDGALWLGTQRGLARWKDGRLVTIAETLGKSVTALEEDRDGTVWVGGTARRTAFLCAVRTTGTECLGDAGRFGPAIYSLSHDTAGDLWIGGKDQAWRMRAAELTPYPLPSPMWATHAMTGTADGAMMVATRDAVVKIRDGRTEKLAVAPPRASPYFIRALRTRNGALWLGSQESGIARLNGDREEWFGMANGLSGDEISAIFEDREENLWVATVYGLDRFRPKAAILYSTAQGIEGRPLSVLPASDGTVWAGTSLGLYRLDRGHASKVAPSRLNLLFEDRSGRIWAASGDRFGFFEKGRFVATKIEQPIAIQTIAEDSKGNIWITHARDGLLRLSSDGKVHATAWKQLGMVTVASALAIDPANDALWIGTWAGSIAIVRDGTLQSNIQLLDPAAVRNVNHIHFDVDGSAWASTWKGVNRVHRGQVKRLDSTNGLPCDPVRWTMSDANSLWIYSDCGLLKVDRREIDAWAAAADSDNRKVKVRRLDHWDGIQIQPPTSTMSLLTSPRIVSPKAARAPDGRIWLATADGVAVVDEAKIPFNGVIPAVHVEQVVGNGTSYEARPHLRLPALQRDLEIAYTALSFTVPEKVRFRYRLEGRDDDWQDAGNRRRAFYTDLPPGDYRFRVIAANNSGVWNETGDSLEFSIAPAWWQTNLFRAACALAFALLLYGVYRSRLAVIARRFNMALDARVNERLRISRELHDTLLQSFQGLLLRFHAGLLLWPAAEGREILEKAMDRANDVLTEGRDAVRGLRSQSSGADNLAESIRELARTLGSENAGEPAIAVQVLVLGTALPLHPLVRDELFRIASEAIRNAFQHAQAHRIDVELRYDARQLRLRVRDDGTGIDRDILEKGREGHFGLGGMRERAMMIDAKLVLWSAPNSGTEVEITVPASAAYADPVKARRNPAEARS